jgi:ABC-type Fe3+ transport system permease subunit
MVLCIFLTARKISYEQSRREEAWTITIILIFIGISIKIISTTSGAVFNASLISSNISNNANTVIFGIIGAIIGIAINVVVVYYLYRPNVKAYFGKAHPTEIK